MLNPVGFAKEAHKDQTRKGDGEPYFNHLKRVAQIVARYTGDPEIIAAAYLHDVIEDTNYTYEDVKRMFGQRVADIVMAVSANKDLPYKKRQADYIRRVSQNSDAIIVSVADKIDNLNSLSKLDDFDIFNIPLEDKLDFYRQVIELAPKEMKKEARTALARVMEKLLPRSRYI